MTENSALRTAFLAELTASGDLSDPDWLAAFRDIPRELFVPYYFAVRPNEPGWSLVEQPDAQWARGVHSSAALITQLDGTDDTAALVRDGRYVGLPTSSSSSPLLMASMLQALDVQAGQRVLEVGTGTGYNAALLCHRLGDEAVTSIDVDQGLVALAGERLAGLGYFPHLAATDGAAGYLERAPFDRIIGTVGLPGVPAEWIAQATVGAKLLVPLDLVGQGGLLALLEIRPDGDAVGRFLPDFGGFMPLRANQHRPAEVLGTVGERDGRSRRSMLAVEVVTDPANPFAFFAALLVGGHGWLGFLPDDGGPAEQWLTQPDGSWVCHVTDAEGRHTVRQGGPTLLWNDIEAAYVTWQQLGEPARERFGLSVRDGRHQVWLDHPGSAHKWPLRGTRGA